MAHQIKVAKGSRFICACGCGRRKTNPNRRFAPGHSRNISGAHRKFKNSWRWELIRIFPRPNVVGGR